MKFDLLDAVENLKAKFPRKDVDVLVMAKNDGIICIRLTVWDGTSHNVEFCLSEEQRKDSYIDMASNEFYRALNELEHYIHT